MAATTTSCSTAILAEKKHSADLALIASRFSQALSQESSTSKCWLSPKVETWNFTKNKLLKLVNFWLRACYLADQFWIRWTREYVHSLQVRQKWMKLEKNFKVNDVVLLYDEHIPRSKWKMTRIVEEYPDSYNKVRQVLVLYGHQRQNYAGYYLKGNACTQARVVSGYDANVFCLRIVFSANLETNALNS